MSSFCFNYFKENILKFTSTATNMFATDFLKMALVTTDFFTIANPEQYSIFDDIITYEINDSSNTATYNSVTYERKYITNLVVDSTIPNLPVLTADDIYYPSSTIDAGGAILFWDGPYYYNFFAIDFKNKISTNNGIFKVELSKGFLRLE